MSSELKPNVKDDPSVLYLRDIIERVKRSGVPVLTIVAISAVSFVAFSYTQTRKYKATGILNVQTDYFRYPLIEEFLPSPSDLSEIGARRDALVRAAFTPEFLDQLGDKYGFLKAPKATVARKQEVENFLGRFEFVSLSQTTVQVSAFAPKADIAESVTEEAIQRIIDTFASERRDKITRARDSIRSRIESMALTQDPTSAVMASERPELLQAELSRLESQIVALTQKFSAQHPTVTRLEKRANSIRDFLKTAVVSGSRSAVAASNKPLVGGEPEKATQEVYDGLVKKLNYLNIALDMESDSRAAFVRVIERPVLPKGSIWPNRFLFMVWGLLCGMVVSSLLIVFKEFLLGAPSRGRKLAKELGTVFIGDFPAVPLAAAATSRGGGGQRESRVKHSSESSSPTPSP